MADDPQITQPIALAGPGWVSVFPTGVGATASVGVGIVAIGHLVFSPGAQAFAGAVTVVAKQSTSVNVTSPIAMQTAVGNVDITGHVFLPDQAFPSDTHAGFSVGMTLRQFYAAHAMQGFISNSVAANLIGKIAPYCFKVADSLLEYEANEKDVPQIVPTLTPTQALPPQSAPVVVIPHEVAPPLEPVA